VHEIPQQRIIAGDVSPADFKTIDMPPATDKVPPVTPWK
jgi:hypothetical protein